jgi:photosystem II stability/assembly factor-like uncharacterized protein
VTRRRAQRLAPFLLSLSGWLFPAEAAANGAFPAVSQIVVDPVDSDRLFLRSTFGIVVSPDRGANWDWICESAAGYFNVEPPMTVLEDGRVILGLAHGVSRSVPGGCGFSLAAGIEANVVDVSRVAGDPERVVALSIGYTDSQVWESTDGGDSFSPLGEPILDFRALTLDVPASEHEVVYVSGFAGIESGDTEGQLLRSDDRGRSFQRYPVPETTSAKQPYIATVDPRDHLTVYVRTDGLPGRLFVTRDGGETITEVLRLQVPIQGFALSPDGATVLATNVYDGSFRADTEAFAFEKIACRGPSCLSWTDAGLFGCGDDLGDGFIVGSSSDQGATFERVVDLSCIRGPLACDADTVVGAECPLLWPGIQNQLGADECAPPEVPTNRDCFEQGGAAGDTSTGTGTGGDGSLGGTNAGGAPPPDAGASGVNGALPNTGGTADAESASCGCSVVTHRNSWLLWPWLGFALWLARRHATRRRVRPSSLL